MIARITVGLVLTAVAFVIAGPRMWWLNRLAFSGPPAATFWGFTARPVGPHRTFR